MGTIQFELREIPHAADEEATGYFPVVADTRRMRAETVYETIEQQCTLTAADIKAVLSALSYVITDALSQGKSIEVGEMGWFYPALGSDRDITDPDDKQIARHLSIEAIRFRPKKALMHKLENVQFRRTETADKAFVRLSNETLLTRIAEYVQATGKQVFDRSDFQKISGYARSTAIRALRDMTAAGLLIKEGRKNAPYYQLA